MRVYRGMRRNNRDGLPKVGPAGSKLGARPGYAEDEIDSEDRFKPGDQIRPDIWVDENGMVQPGTGGMSVALPPMNNLVPHRRPPKHGGDDSSYEVYELDTDDLPEGLKTRGDPYGLNRHFFIEPALEVSFDEYQRILESTRALWTRVP